MQIAILVRARTHLRLIARRLRKAGLPFRAVEIEPLSDRQEVMDLTALTQALLHPMDRIAWLTVLRAPWCGLTLSDLHTLCGSDGGEHANRAVMVLLGERMALLSTDGQQRVGRVYAVLEAAVRGKHRQVSLGAMGGAHLDYAGGAGLCGTEQGTRMRALFFALLEDLGPEAAALKDRIVDLCAQPDPDADEQCGVQLMTIHKAKGLGFDVVIVPGLERLTKGEQQPLLHWLEQTRLVGSAEQEEREFLVAPIGHNGEPGGIYKWIGDQQQEREDEEGKRLLYVAATRARSEAASAGNGNHQERWGYDCAWVGPEFAGDCVAGAGGGICAGLAGGEYRGANSAGRQYLNFRL